MHLFTFLLKSAMFKNFFLPATYTSCRIDFLNFFFQWKICIRETFNPAWKWTFLIREFSFQPIKLPHIFAILDIECFWKKNRIELRGFFSFKLKLFLCCNFCLPASLRELYGGWIYAHCCELLFATGLHLHFNSGASMLKFQRMNSEAKSIPTPRDKV